MKVRNFTHAACAATCISCYTGAALGPEAVGADAGQAEAGASDVSVTMNGSSPNSSADSAPEASATRAGDGAADGGCGLPSDVAQVLQTYCVSCHSTHPIGGAPMPLETYADLLAPAVSNPFQTVGQISVTRMLSSTRPMPPAGAAAPTAQQVSSFQSWVSAGMPEASCSSSNSTSVDAGADASGSGADSASYDTPIQCTSGVTSTVSEGPTMRPGDACGSCHNRFTIAGTVYPSAHEPALCNGADVSGMTVVITDATGAVTMLAVNSVGNFYSSASIASPFEAKVVSGSRQRAMATSQTSGDCNNCHTEQGANGAPGRILEP